MSIRTDNLSWLLQAKGVKVVADYVAQLRRVSDGHGVWHFDRILQADATKLNTPAVESIPA
jgi:SH3-like domain-containing protein